MIKSSRSEVLMFALPKETWEKKKTLTLDLSWMVCSKWLARHYFTVVGASNSAPSQMSESVVSGAALIT